MLVGHVLGILLQGFGFLLPGASFGRGHSFRACNICGSQEKHSSEPFLGAAGSAAAGGGGSSRSPSAVRGVRCANLPLRPALAAVTITGSCKSWTLTLKLEEVPVASSKPGHAPHSFGVLHLAAGNSLSKWRGSNSNHGNYNDTNTTANTTLILMLVLMLMLLLIRVLRDIYL